MTDALIRSRLFDTYPVHPGDWGYYRLEVTTNLYGQAIFVPVHVGRGRTDGPCLLLTATIHGNEHPPIRVMYRLRQLLDLSKLSGTVVMVPVANPAAFARDKRKTPEIDIDFANMNRVFPGRRAKPAFGEGVSQPSDITLTERLAQVLADRVIPAGDYLMDFHCHAEGCCLAETICPTPEGDIKGQGLAMALAFGWGIAHEDDSSSVTCDGYAHTLGITGFSPEIGGSGLGSRLESMFVDVQVRGTLNVLRYLGMYPGGIEPYTQQTFVYRQCPKVRPTVSGYLVSHICPEDLFSDDIMAGRKTGARIRKGDLMGEVFDPYSLERVEELRAPADGLVYLSRKDGLVLAGSLAYGVAADDGARLVSR